MRPTNVYVWRDGLGLVEVSRPDPGAKVHLQTDAGFDGLVATDGTDISSRSKWEAYMRENNLTVANDFKETWEKAAKERLARMAPGSGREERVAALRRVLYEMNPRDVANIARRAREQAMSDRNRPQPLGRGWED